MGEALASSRYRHLLIELCAIGHSQDFGKRGEGAPSLDRPLAELASAALSRAHQKLLKQGQGFELLSKAERHDLRIALKRLRYALDFFGGVFKGDARKEFNKRLRRLQDDLGGMNDVAVAETMLARFVGVAPGDVDPPAQVAQQGHGILRRRGARLAPSACGGNRGSSAQGLGGVCARQTFLVA